MHEKFLPRPTLTTTVASLCTSFAKHRNQWYYSGQLRHAHLPSIYLGNLPSDESRGHVESPHFQRVEYDAACYVSNLLALVDVFRALYEGERNLSSQKTLSVLGIFWLLITSSAGLQ